MRFKKVFFVAASLALSVPSLSAAFTDFDWNGRQSGYHVGYVNGLPVVLDASGNVVTTAIPESATPVEGGSGVIDATTANWVNLATNTPQSLAGAQSTDALSFDGVGGVILVKSGATPGFWNFYTGGYSVVPANGTLNYQSITLAPGAGSLTLYDAFGTNTTISGTNFTRYEGTRSLSWRTPRVSSTALSGNANFVKNGPGLLQLQGYFSNSTAHLIGGGVFAITGNSVRMSSYLYIGCGWRNGVLKHARSERAGPVGRTVSRYDGARPIWSHAPGRGLFFHDRLSGPGARSPSIRVSSRFPGYINVWSQNAVSHVGSSDSSPDSYFQVASMTGTSSVVLNGTAELNFTNSLLNVAPGLHSDLSAGGGSLTETKRYNFVNNLKAGLNNDQLQTRLFTGLDNTYRIDINIDAAPIEGTQVVGVGATATTYITQTYDTNPNRGAVHSGFRSASLRARAMCTKTGLGSFQHSQQRGNRNRTLLRGGRFDRAGLPRRGGGGQHGLIQPHGHECRSPVTNGGAGVWLRRGLPRCAGECGRNIVLLQAAVFPQSEATRRCNCCRIRRSAICRPELRLQCRAHRHGRDAGLRDFERLHDREHGRADGRLDRCRFGHRSQRSRADDQSGTGRCLRRLDRQRWRDQVR